MVEIELLIFLMGLLVSFLTSTTMLSYYGKAKTKIIYKINKKRFKHNIIFED
jgi:hypothetical protein